MPRKKTSRRKPATGHLIQFSDFKREREIRRAQIICMVYVEEREGKEGDILLCSHRDRSLSFKPCKGITIEAGGQKSYTISEARGDELAIIGRVAAIEEVEK